MKAVISCLIAVLISANETPISAVLSDQKGFHFEDEILVEKIPFPGSVTTYLKGNLLPTGQLQCTFAVFLNFTRWENRLKEIKCRGLQIMGLSTKHQIGHWKLTISKQDDAAYAKLILERLGTQVIPLPEYLIIVCCLFQENVRQPDPAVLCLVALPEVQHPIDLENITDKERNYKHPHLIDIAPCPCDLTENNCDTFCCCDPDCPAAYIDIFRCITGWYGGQRFKPFENQKCYSTEKKSEHDSITCIYFANSAFLGNFYPDIAKIEDEASFGNVASDKKHIDEIHTASHINKHEKAAHSNLHPKYYQQNASLPIYHYGEKIQVISSHTGISRSANWYFPISLYDGSCTLSYPLHFLINLYSLCNVQLKNICEQGTLLNTSLDSKLYAADTLVLLQAPGSSMYAQTNVTYLCAKDMVYRKYDILNTAAFSEIVQCKPQDLPPSPKYVNGVCTNIVLEVRHSLFWKNGKILLKNITIILGDIPVESRTNQIWHNSSFLLLTQHFSVEFYYIMNITNSSVEAASTSEPTSEAIIRSGNPGYNVGLPVISAINSYTNGTTVTIVGNYLNLWKAGATGRCESAETRPILFGVNSLSGCSLEIKIAETNYTCRILKSMLFNALNSIMSAEYISVGGSPNVENINDFIPLLIEEKFDLSLLDNETDNSLNCLDIPNHIHLEIAYAEVDQVNYTPVMKIIGAFLRYQTINSTVPRYDVGYKTINFAVTSSVQFVEISLSKKQIKRFWDLGEIQYCNRETCWEEMLYPFTDDFRAETLYSTILLFLPMLGIVLSAS